ncbi:diacylglycerol kinase [Sphaerisporangium melleum]|uniref:Diacylglycerol kinase n=1 Tax=Sphaerisporangium melleum TaxID=321316 RepID=A0A917RM26_9ACTN|nr:YegS/Rv2252/BmrU family lipid kinase [Sphaerisporangium melleum]GGL13998.1 diacylglycerol kinase [Sphaerisporangium melleum]GII74602.1 diacylglycerol kinase [Sphaerisporangium melleum]
MAGELVVLVNPAARGGRTLRLLDPVVRRLRDGGRPVSVIVGTSAQDALELACTAVAEGPEALVAFGGDGLVHLAVQAVAGTDVPLGIIPAGTGNDIADAFGIPKNDPLAAAAIVAEGTVRTVDAGTAGEEWFAGVVACGFDSKVNERANRMTRPAGMAKYLLATLQELRAFTPIPFRLTVDGEVIEQEAMMVAVGNTHSYGAGMRVCPEAVPDDGLLDVLIVGPLPTGAFLRAFPRVYRGTHLGHPAITLHRARTVTVEAPDVVAYADGERIAPLPLTCTIHPGSLRIITSAGA